ncbi:hypothetical protein M9H77_07917 [Catharanthus roseus]|uniref:Uncharacterized protein n=1 Tax=Catharanthus roseus TaxID=4058 RepID=A0ACC0BWI5_CATRO|nr:hypothetical protein M9H77_07917 [Catharanthus roseus]
MFRHVTSATSWGNSDFYNLFLPEITLLPVPKTRIGDLTMYISSRGLLTRNSIISIRLGNLIVVIIDGRVQHRRKTYDALRSMKTPSLSFEQSKDCDPYLGGRPPPDPSPLSTSCPRFACPCLPGKEGTGGRPPPDPSPLSTLC